PDRPLHRARRGPRRARHRARRLQPDQGPDHLRLLHLGTGAERGDPRHGDPRPVRRLPGPPSLMNLPQFLRPIPRQYDAIVVGSGITGGWAAKELCELGLRTLVLEAGREIVPERDYSEHIQAWELPFRGFGDRKALERNQPIQKTCYACDE